MQMNKIMFYSTNHNAPRVSFKEALLKGQAPDRGLYMPEVIPRFTTKEINEFSDLPYHRIAYQVAEKFLFQQISSQDLSAITRNSYDFEVPLENVYERKYVMRLDQGPTASFKDFAARMMGRQMQNFLQEEKRELLILTATSGDTGSAIANAFYKLDNIKVVVLFPEDEVTARQRKQMTTLGENIQILGLKAKFDDCQSLVKQAFADPELDYLKLSSANSINIGRLIPQIVYYFYAFAKLRSGDAEEKAIFSIPSGNFGDMMGGMLALRMGLPVKRFVIATNENDEFPLFIKTGEYEKIQPSRNCISSAMNVGHPSNLARFVDLYGGKMDENGFISKTPDLELIRKEIYAVSINDSQTEETIIKAYKDHGLLLEPHGSVGWAGLMNYLKTHREFDTEDQLCISLETAHPAKFPEKIRQLLQFDPPLPSSLQGLEAKQESFDKINNDYKSFKKYLQDNY